MIYLAAYKGRDSLWDRLIQYWTGYKYSHCELVVNNISYSSSMQDGGVRAASINYNSGHWDIVPITFVDSIKVLNHYQKTKGHKYSYSDLVFKQILNTKFNNTRADFCSEWCAEALGIPISSSLNPGELIELVKYIESLTNVNHNPN